METRIERRWIYTYIHWKSTPSDFLNFNLQTNNANWNQNTFTMGRRCISVEASAHGHLHPNATRASAMHTVCNPDDVTFAVAAAEVISFETFLSVWVVKLLLGLYRVRFVQFHLGRTGFTKFSMKYHFWIGVTIESLLFCKKDVTICSGNKTDSYDEGSV